MTSNPDPDLYARMAAPYASHEEAQAAITAFLEGVAKLREEHRIAEVVMIAGAYVPELVAQTMGLGDARRAHLLAATLTREALLNAAEACEQEAEDLRSMAAEVSK